jgi:type I restriction enzyme R subunit
MSVGQTERRTQDRIVRFLVDELGYNYLGNFQDDEPHGNVQEDRLRQWLERRGEPEELAKRALQKLESARQVGGQRSLYQANKEVYQLLRYGASVKARPGAKSRPVKLIDWENASTNDFAVAEEVPVTGVNDKRPDVVI